MPYGTNTILDTLAASNQTVAQFGVDDAFGFLRQALAAHNENMRDMVANFIGRTTDRLRRGGSYSTMVMAELDEFGTPDAQKLTAGSNIGFPLRRFGIARQWTGLALKRMMASELAAQMTGVMDADVAKYTAIIKQTIYRPTNYTSDDALVDRLNAIQLPIKALANADSFPIPPGPNGETFDAATHNHYLVAATPGTFAVADADALVNTVREHYKAGQGMIALTTSETTAISAMPKFKAVVDARIVQANTATFVNPAVASLDTTNTNNRMIGIYDGFDVWVKPWATAGYPVSWWSGAGVGPVILQRRDPELPENLTMTFEGEVHDTKADVLERYYGMGIYNRIGMAVLDIAHGTYTSPV